MKRGLVAFVAGVLLGLALRVVLFFFSTFAVDLLADMGAWLVALLPSVDPVYTRAALQTLANLDVSGLVIADPLGETLHAMFPSIVVGSARSGGTLVRLVPDPSSAVLARLVAAGLTHMGVLALGFLLIWRGARRRSRLLLVGLGMQVPVALSVLAGPPSLQDLESTGLSFAISAAAPWIAGRRVALSDLAMGVSPHVVRAGLVAGALLLCSLAALSLAGLILGISRTLGRVMLRAQHRSGPAPRSGRAALAWGATVVTLVSGSAFVAATGSLASAATLSSVAMPQPGFHRQVKLRTGVASGAAAGRPSQGVLAMLGLPDLGGPNSLVSIRRDSWPSDLHAQKLSDQAHPPSRVEVQGTAGNYQYLVNGHSQVIRGMGLNTQYARFPPMERRARLDRDLETMRRMGVNTVLGWDPAELDGLLLDVAEQHHLGVVLPFHLDPAADYTDPQVRQALTGQVIAWVQQYKRHPALRMWGLGNEVLHKIVHPSWVGPQDPAREVQARAFSAWLVETVDVIHALDPEHPVTYRSAEDAFVPWVVEALNARGGGPRPWFVFGSNCYTKYLSDIVDKWPSRGFNGPLWISEFAPGGTAPAERPRVFKEMWGYVRRHPQWVLGGAVYAWTRQGPEEIDRTMGITDDGAPSNPQLMSALTDLFQQGATLALGS